MSNKYPSRILNILPDNFPPELRVENANQALSQAGFEVMMMARPSGIQSDRWAKEIEPIDPPSPLGKVIRRIRRRALAAFRPTLATGLSRTWIMKQAKHFGAEAIIWNDLAGAHVGASIASELDAKFVLDLHENYPYNMWSTARDRNLKGKYYSASTWFDYEEQMTAAADLILTPAKEMNERLNAMHFTPNEKMLEVLNSENPRVWDAMDIHPITEMPADRDHLLYVGSASIHRGLDVIVRALAIIKKDWPELLFTIVGSGRSISQLEMLVGEHGLEQNVQMLGQRPFSEMASFIHHSDIGVIPHYRYGQTDNTIPHKLFQFAALKKPLLVSNCKSLERITKDHHLGLVFSSGNPQDAAEKMLTLKKKSQRQEMGGNGRKALEGPLNLVEQQAKLVAAFQALFS